MRVRAPPTPPHTHCCPSKMTGFVGAPHSELQPITWLLPYETASTLFKSELTTADEGNPCDSRIRTVHGTCSGHALDLARLGRIRQTMQACHFAGCRQTQTMPKVGHLRTAIATWLGALSCSHTGPTAGTGGWKVVAGCKTVGWRAEGAGADLTVIPTKRGCGREWGEGRSKPRGHVVTRTRSHNNAHGHVEVHHRGLEEGGGG